MCVKKRLAGAWAGLWLAAASAAAQDFPVEGVLARLYEQGYRLPRLTAPHPMGGSATMDLSLEPGPEAQFNGERVKSARITLTMTDASGQSERARGDLFFSTAPFRPAGGINLLTGSYTVAERLADPPAAARVGSAAPLTRITHFTDAAKAQVIATGVTRWSLEPSNGGQALLCLSTDEQYRAPDRVVAIKNCVQIDSAGALHGGRYEMSTQGLTLSFR